MRGTSSRKRTHLQFTKTVGALPLTLGDRRVVPLGQHVGTRHECFGLRWVAGAPRYGVAALIGAQDEPRMLRRGSAARVWAGASVGMAGRAGCWISALDSR